MDACRHKTNMQARLVIWYYKDSRLQTRYTSVAEPMLSHRQQR